MKFDTSDSDNKEQKQKKLISPINTTNNMFSQRHTRNWAQSFKLT